MYLVLCIPAVLMILAFTVVPLVNGLRVSLYKWNGYSQHMTFIGLQNFKDIWPDKMFWVSFWNTMIYGFGSTILQNIMGLSAALFLNAKWQCVRSLYRCLIAAMLAGRAVWAVAEVLLLGIGENGFTFKMFISGALLNSIPGIILQLVLIPAIMLALDKTHLVPFRKSEIKTKARES